MTNEMVGLPLQFVAHAFISLIKVTYRILYALKLQSSFLKYSNISTLRRPDNYSHCFRCPLAVVLFVNNIQVFMRTLISRDITR